MIDLKKAPDYHNSRWNNKRRLDTFNFVHGSTWEDLHNKSVLAIGPENEFDKQIFPNAQFTKGDFDHSWEPIEKKKYDVIIMFEVIEHVMNPLKLLEEIKQYMHEHSYLFISYPFRNSYFWIDYHFHEYDVKRFRFLLQEAGYSVLKYKEVAMTGFRGMGIHTFPRMIKQPRSILRRILSITPFGWVKKQYYLVRFVDVNNMIFN